MRMLSAGILSTVFILSSGSPGVAGERLAALSARWTEALDGIVLEHAMGLKRLREQYARTVEQTKVKYQKAGDLGGVQALIAEAERFAEQGGVPDVAPEGALPELARLQEAYRRHLGEAAATKARKIAGLARDFDLALQKLEKSLTQAGGVAEATAVQEMRKALPEGEQVKMALALLAAAEKKDVAAGRSVPGDDPEEGADVGLPRSSDGWPLVLLDEPFHLGDQTQNAFKHPAPQGREFRASFVLDRGTPSLYAGVWLFSTVGPDHGDYKAGHYQIKFILNDEEVAVLNKKLPRRRSPDDPDKVVVRLSARDVRSGTNELQILAGAKGKNISEAEIHRIILDVKRP